MVRIHSLFDPKEDYVFDINIDRKAVVKQKTKIRADSTETEMSRLLRTSMTAKTCHVMTSVKPKRRPITTSVEPKPSPSPLKWGLSHNSQTIPPPIRLEDIIKEEETKKNQFTRLTSSKAKAIPMAKMRTTSWSKASVSLFEALKSKNYSPIAVSPSPPKNPCKRIDIPSFSQSLPLMSDKFPAIDEVLSMADIVRKKEEEIRNLKAIENRALDVISAEDKAIEELLDYYCAEDNPEEWVTVKRLCSRVAEPVWSRTH